ncbi:MAG TPA: trypsin-like peptidase domain-containing protein [Polyangia bacterium]
MPRPAGPVSVGPIESTDGQSAGGAGRLLTKADGPRFSGIATAAIGDTCSGALVVASADPAASNAPAYLLTAGHCAQGGFPPPNAVVSGLELGGSPTSVRFREFADSQDAAVGTRASRVIFSTMKGMDLALIQLVSTRAELRARGIVPFVLSGTPTAAGEEVAIVGHPNLQPATISTCRFARRLPVVLEGGYHWFDAEADDCQGEAPGSSGSPVFSLATGLVVAVENTLAEPLLDGFSPCALNHPCEVTSAGVQYADGAVYAMGVSGLLACFDSTGSLDLQRSGCPLDRGVGMDASPQMNLVAAGGGQPVSFTLAANGLTHHRWAFGAAGTVDCRAVDGYGAVQAWATAPAIQVVQPAVGGVSLLCLQAGVGPDPAGSGWQDLATPTVIQLETSEP